jgi:hypothetical protein
MPSRKKCSKAKVWRPKYTSCSGRKIKGKCVKRSSKRQSKKSCKRSCKKVCKPSFLQLDIAWQKIVASKNAEELKINHAAVLALINDDINKAKEFFNLNFNRLLKEARLASNIALIESITTRVENIKNQLIKQPRSIPPSIV